MKKLFLFLSCSVFSSSLLFFITNLYAQKNQETTPSSIINPLPDPLLEYIPKVLGAHDQWLPNTANLVASSQNLTLTAKSALSYDLTSEALIYSKNSKEKLPIASLTKIMTAIIALENDDLRAEYTVSERAATIGENSMGLEAGEIHTLEDLLYGLMLPSGNDAAEVIAENSKFGRENFVYMMNKKAEDLGLANTRFSNPSGLEGDGLQYSTVEDLLILTRYALQNPIFKKVVNTYEYTIEPDENNKGYTLYNETNLLTTYPGVKGVKTGFTFEAGLCLITYLEHNNRKIVAILLNSENRRQEMKDLLDYSLLTLGETPPPHS